jgi:SAM-dependent methyltransferase
MVDDEDTACFYRQLAENAAWFRCMGMSCVDIFRPGVTVMDFGCGHGALALQAAQFGARVSALDTNPNRILFARRHLALRYPLSAGRIQFLHATAQDLPGEARYDVIVSKDTFEHASNLPAVLAALHRLLRPGGRAYIGMSPLWYSPFGDHGHLTRGRLPWAHLLCSDRRFLQAHNARTGRFDQTVGDAGFNRWRPGDFRAAFADAGFVTEKIRINAASLARRLAILPLDAVRLLPALEAFATIGMYATLRRDRELARRARKSPARMAGIGEKYRAAA